MSSVIYSVYDAKNAIQSVLAGGSLQEGAELNRNNPLQRFTRWLKSWLENSEPEQNFLNQQTLQITRNIINAKSGEHKWQCGIVFNDTSFLLSKSDAYPDSIVIQDVHTNEETIIHGLSFSTLQRAMLERYLQEARRNGQHPIDLSSFNLAGIDVRGIDLTDTLLNKQTATDGTEKRYASDLTSAGVRRRLALTASQQIDKDRTNLTQVKPKKRSVGNSSRTYSPARNTRTDIPRGVLPPALQQITPEHWKQLSNIVFQETQTTSKSSIRNALHKTFYEDIYKTASSNSKYLFSTDDTRVRKEEWSALCTSADEKQAWKPDGIRHGERAHIKKGKNSPDDIESTQVFLHYYQAPTKSRLQFVVSSEAGPALYRDIGRIMDEYIDAECIGDSRLSPVKSFKVFSEDTQVGRPDSAVMYLSAPLNDPRVQKLVSYLEKAIGARITPINVIGATPVGNGGVHGTTIPNEQLQKKLTGYQTSSNGGLVGNVLVRAYRMAYTDIRHNGILLQDNRIERLNQRAQFYASKIWRDLGL